MIKYGGWNEIGADSFHLQRLHGDPNFERMKNWLTFDPRIESVSRYTPQNEKFDKQLFQAALASTKTRDCSRDAIFPVSMSQTAPPSSVAGKSE